MRNLTSTPKQNKKGQVNMLTPGVIALVLAAVFLVFGIVMLQELRDTDVIRSTALITTVNESITSVSHAPKTVAGASSPGFHNFNIIRVINGSTGAIIPASNYTFFSNNGTFYYKIAQGNLGGFNGSTWNVTYEYERGDDAYLATNKTLIGFGTFADFWEIIVLAIVISVVIGLLIMVFGGRQSR